MLHIAYHQHFFFRNFFVRQFYYIFLYTLLAFTELLYFVDVEFVKHVIVEQKSVMGIFHYTYGFFLHFILVIQHVSCSIFYYVCYLIYACNRVIQKKFLFWIRESFLVHKPQA